MIKVLLIDDDIKLCKAIQKFMNGEMEIKYIDSPDQTKILELKQYIFEQNFDVIVFDLEIGNTNGLDLFKQLMPLTGISKIFLSGASNVNNRIEALRAGADDFLQKPIDLMELQVKIEKQVLSNKTSIYEYIYDYKIDNQTEQIYLGEKLLDLPPMAEKLLKYLLKNPNRPLSREELVKNVWGYSDEGGSRIIDTAINTIRNITRDPNIRTIRGVGYKYEKLK